MVTASFVYCPRWDLSTVPANVQVRHYWHEGRLGGGCEITSHLPPFALISCVPGFLFWFSLGACDGSVRSVSFSIDAMIHAPYGSCNDGLPVD